MPLPSKHIPVLLLAAFFSASCGSGNGPGKPVADKYAATDTLSETQKHLPENALKGLIVAGSLEVTPVASEPMLTNPTNMDVDERGRIWVVEAYNYRPKINGNPVNPQGDRILILEDINGDGRADKSKVFYQGAEINAPMGISVLGNRVLISQSPYVWSFYDDNGDDSADRKEVLFQGIGGEQHDHGMHTFSFGPDGKLYFNFGNEGKTLKDKAGKTVLDQDGDEIGPGKYKQGMVFRCNPDGTQVECLGNNFRNNYEVAVDSYGTMWQSDNDDDGNKGVRINYVMEYGNYGYHDEMTDAAWQATRTNMEDSVYEQHWHLNDPGVVPNLLQTGAGSPTGMIVYEGSLLPSPFRGQMIHCDPGQNVVRSYPVTKSGAGYKASIANLSHDDNDQWFRPVDVCTAPDGSLLIADWYDPIVGGHGAGDQDRGRLYRIAPKGSAYRVPVFDFTTPSGAVAALQNPNLAARYRAWTALQQMGKKAVPELEKLWRSTADPRMRARALWALSKMQSGKTYISEAVKDPDADIRITGLRAARQLNGDVLAVVKTLSHDADPQVLRECALALRHQPSQEAATLWAELASQYNGNDRWLLEALGIGADRQWKPFFTAYTQQNKDPLQTATGRDLIWRSRGENVLPLLSELAMDSGATLQSRLRYFRAFDFHGGASKTQALLHMLAANISDNNDLNLLLLHHLDPKKVQQSKAAMAALDKVLLATYGTPAYLNLIRQYKIKSENPKLLRLALVRYNDPVGAEAVRLLIENGEGKLLPEVIKDSDEDAATKFLTVFGSVGYTETINLLQDVTLSDQFSKPIRTKAAAVLGKSYGGEDRVLDLLRDKQVPAEFIPAIVSGLKGNVRTGMYKKAMTYLPGAATGNAEKPAPAIAALMLLNGDASKGSALFESNCTVCHQVRGVGKDFGPKLSEIGSKLPREALYKAIVSPSSAVSFGYEATRIVLKNGTTVTGIIASKTKTELQLKYPGGTVQQIRIGDIKNMKELQESLMPPMHDAMSDAELADVVQYLATLTKK